jgi:hypothetical protein
LEISGRREFFIELSIEAALQKVCEKGSNCEWNRGHVAPYVLAVGYNMAHKIKEFKQLTDLQAQGCLAPRAYAPYSVAFLLGDDNSFSSKRKGFCE